jgi:starch synthase
MSALKLCIVASEMVPFSKTGGLADAVGALARQLAMAGHEVRAFLPLYASVRSEFGGLMPVPQAQNIAVPVGVDRIGFSLYRLAPEPSGLSVYFVDCPLMFDRQSLYTNDSDEHRRFILFTRACIEACQHLAFSPDIFHCNDWHTAFLPLYLQTVYSWDRLFARSRTVLTIHNIGYQGEFSSIFAPDLSLGFSESRLHQDDLKAGFINSLKHGILYADAITTVSPTYAVEIGSSMLGMGMQDALARRRDEVVGILNGVDYGEWDPRIDQHLVFHYHSADLRGKTRNKQRLIARVGLAFGDAVPIIGMVTRLTEQKGIDLLFDSLPGLLRNRLFGLVVLGSGEDRYVAFFRWLMEEFPGQVAFRAGYDEHLAHLIEAGGDIFLMPSRYEPCGLNQMYSLRYGTIPVVRKTGGLADSVQHYDPASGTGTGVVFDHYDAPAVTWALNTALDWYTDQRTWRRIMRNAMEMDFSWQHQVVEYERLYRRLTGSAWEAA